MSAPGLPRSRRGGEILVDGLIGQGAQVAFGVPGESFLAALDGMFDRQDRFRFIVCRQEGGAAFMAEAWGKLTHRPGVAFVTRGPGACNAAIGVHTATHDATPMVLFIGQVERAARDREAFQEVDYRRMFAPLAKWVGEIDRADRIPEYLHRAFHLAQSGRPGPVVLVLPEDMLMDEAAVEDLPRAAAPACAPDAGALADLERRLLQSARPLLVLGGGQWTAQAAAAVAGLASKHEAAVACSFRRQDHVDNRLAHYVGDLGVAADPQLVDYLADADLVIALGARLGEIASGGYTFFSPQRHEPRLVSVHPSADETGRSYSAGLAIQAHPADVLAAAGNWSQPAPHVLAGRRAWVDRGRAHHLEWSRPLRVPGDLQLADVIRFLRAALPEDAIVTNGAGNYATFVHRYWTYTQAGTQLAPTSGAMGYGVPAAIAAQLAHPGRRVVCFAGDGCFMMNGQELATARKYRLPILFIVVNNGMFGTIRMHQERQFPRRVSGTDLDNPDFALLARSHGLWAATVRRTEAFEPALAQAIAHQGPALIECILDPDALTPGRSLSQIRAASLEACPA